MIRRTMQSLLRTRLWKMDIHPSARIAATALIDRTYPAGVHIAAGVVIDEEAVVLTHDVTRGLFMHTHVGEGATLGPRAIVLPGVTIGPGANVLAGAVVLKDVPAGAVVGGNPARVVMPEEVAGAGSSSALASNVTRR